MQVTHAAAALDTLWGPVTLGDSVEVEVFAPAALDRNRELFVVSQVSHLFADPRRAAKAIGSAGACERDVKCFSLSTLASSNARATVLLTVTISGGQTFSCSGTLMNTDPYSGIPYVLTDPGCIVDSTEAATLNTFFEFEATACGSNVAQSFVRRTGGSSLVLRNASAGFSFVRLNDSAPAGSWFSGWAPAAASAGTSVFAVHHPEGDLKKLSVGSIVSAGSSLQVRFTTGVTENGSIGSAIFRDDQYVVGLLYGGASSCANPSGLDDYAPFSTMWTTGLNQYLRPTTAPPLAQNYSDIWWNPNESGWGLTIADHETQLFAVWYTYREDGSPTWLVIPGGTFTQGRRLFSGTMYRTTGPAYNAPFNPNAVTVTSIGSASLDFAPPGLSPGIALFTYSVGAITRTKQIQRQSFGDGASNWGTDFTDIWWDPNESGWGLTLSQHGNNVFGVWYTYDASGQPLFVVMPGVTFAGPDSFSGDLYTTTGPFYGNASFDSTQVRVTPVGRASIAFDPVQGAFLPRRAAFTPTVHGYVQRKTIAPQSFGNARPANPITPTTYQLVVTTAGTGTGSVTSAPAGISCGAAGGACAASFARGSTVTLTAAAASGSRFVSFTGTCSSPTASCVVTMSAAATVTATFERLPTASTLAIQVVNPLPPATAGQPYSQQAARGFGGQPPYHYQSDTFASGAPPLGMIIDLNGFLTGTPSSSYTTQRTFTFGICVVDVVATSRCGQTSITVNPPAPAQNGTIGWTIGNQCNNGFQIQYKFHDRANGWVWPSASTHYLSNYGQTASVSLSCFGGSQVCIGARSSNGALSWGVGYNDTSGCSNCCGTCDGRTYSYTFGCSSPPPSGGGQCTGLLGGPRACQPCNSDADCGENICWTGPRPAPFCS